MLDAPVTDNDIVLEERALDSYHNVLFSLTLFWGRFGTWPRRVTIVSHAFKKERIMGHCAAIGFPLERVAYIGIDPPGLDEKQAAMDGARAAVADWAADAHGRGDKLKGKRRSRNPWRVWQGLFDKTTANTSGLVTTGQGEDETVSAGGDSAFL